MAKKRDGKKPKPLRFEFADPEPGEAVPLTEPAGLPKTRRATPRMGLEMAKAIWDKALGETIDKVLSLQKTVGAMTSERREIGLSPLERVEKEFEKSLENPRVSVVIVNHNGVDFLWNCLFALKTQTYPPHEILLVDNASKDASLPFVRDNYSQVNILECQENFGFAMASNLGAKYATGDIVAILNNDTIATPDWLARMVAELKQHWPQVGAISSDVRSKHAPDATVSGIHQTLNILGSLVPGFFDEIEELFYPEGCAFLYARFLAPEGPFDPDYFIYQDDVFFGWKLRMMNRQVRRSSSARVFHDPGGSMGRFPQWKSVYYRFRNRWLNLFLLYEKRTLIRVFPWLMVEVLARLLRSLGVGWNTFFGIFLAVSWFLTHPMTVYRKRQAIQEKRKASDEEVLKCLSGRIVGDHVWGSRLLNLLSLAYCRVVGLDVMEFHKD